MKVSIDNLIAMNVLMIGVLTAGYGVSVIVDIKHMQDALTGKVRLVPMPEVIDFNDVQVKTALK